jgi:hypothetical protein
VLRPALQHLGHGSLQAELPVGRIAFSGTGVTPDDSGVHHADAELNRLAALHRQFAVVNVVQCKSRKISGCGALSPSQKGSRLPKYIVLHAAQCNGSNGEVEGVAARLKGPIMLALDGMMAVAKDSTRLSSAAELTARMA